MAKESKTKEEILQAYADDIKKYNGIIVGGFYYYKLGVKEFKDVNDIDAVFLKETDLNDYLKHYAGRKLSIKEMLNRRRKVLLQDKDGYYIDLALKKKTMTKPEQLIALLRKKDLKPNLNAIDYLIAEIKKEVKGDDEKK